MVLVAITALRLPAQTDPADPLAEILGPALKNHAAVAIDYNRAQRAYSDADLS